jgi:hypothetical protein
LVSLRRKSEVGLGGQEEEGFVLRSLKSLAELLDLSAFPFCGGVVTAFLALSRSRLFFFHAFCCLSLSSRVFGRDLMTRFCTRILALAESAIT